MADTGNLIKRVVLSQNDSEMMKRLKEYTSSCAYLRNDEAKNRIKTYINCGCDYKRTLDVLGGSEKSLRSAVNYANDALKSKVGADIVDMIKQGDSMAEMILDAAMGDAKPVVSDLWYNIPSYRNKGFDLRECITELKVIFTFAKTNMQYGLSLCDDEKLAYIKHLITNPLSIDRRTAAILQKYLNKPTRKTIRELADMLQEIYGKESDD